MKQLLLLVLIFSTLFADDLLSRITASFDELYKSSSSEGTLTMYVKTANWERTMTMQSWSKGKDLMMIKLITPVKERGLGTLKVKNRMWNFLPKTDKVILVPPSMMMGGWMGSDITNDDIVGEYTLAEDYDLQLLSLDKSRPGIRQIKCTPKLGREILWGFLMIDIEEKTLLPIRQRNFDEKNRLVRTTHFKDVKLMDGKRIPTVIEVISETKQGNLTRLTYNSMKFDQPIEDTFFTLTKLREPIRELK